MENLKATSPNRTTLAMISQQKAEKLAEIQASKQRINQQAKELFRPSEDSGNTHHLMNNFSSGIAIFNGIMTGFKIIRRIRNLFR